MASRSILLNTDSRVFIKEKADCCSANYAYHACMRLGELSKDYGDVTSEYCPDENKYGQFVEVAVIRGVEARATTNLAGRLPRKYRSILESLGSKKCPFELQLHFGFCGNPSNFNEYEIGLVLEDVIITNYSTDALGALSPDEAGSILETVELNVGRYYYISPLDIFNLTSTVSIPNLRIIDAIACERPSCFGCENCECALYAIGYEDGEVDMQLIASLDGGATWVINDLGIIIPETDVNTDEGLFASIHCFGDDIYITTETENPNVGGDFIPYVYSVNAVEALSITTATVTMVYDGELDTNAYPATGMSYAFASKIVYFNGDYYAIQVDQGTPPVYYIRQIPLDSSNVSTTVYSYGANLAYENGLQIYNNEIIMAGMRPSVGNTPNYLYSTDGLTWIVKTIPLYLTLGLNAGGYGPGTTAPYPIDEKNWLIFVNGNNGVDTCRSVLFCTSDGGATYSYNGIFNTGCNVSISYSPTRNVLYAIGLYSPTANLGLNTLLGKIWRSIDGGKTWAILPDASTGGIDYDTNTFNADTTINIGAPTRQLTGCDNDPNLIYSASELGVLKFN